MSRSKNPAAYAAIAKKTFLFAGIEEEKVKALLGTPGVTVEHFSAGEAIRTRRDPVGSLGIIAYGAATVEKSGASGKILMSLLAAGDLFGAAAMFNDNDTYVADIAASESTWVIMIPEGALVAIMKTDYRIVENYLKYLTARIRFLSDRIDGFAEGSVEERVIHFLSRNAVNGVVNLKVSLSGLAEALAVSRATLYRALEGLEQAGRIHRDRKTITILKEEA